jgi:CheY-like chemotaxis protein
MTASAPAADPAGPAPPRTPSTTGRGPVLLFGSPTAPGIASTRAAAEQARLPVIAQTSLADADQRLEQSHPAAIVIDAPSKSAETACLHFRYNPMLANVPIVVAAESVSDLAFEEAYGWGADDVVPRNDAATLTRRLRQIVLAGAVPQARRRGLAVVADGDRRRRILCARVLRNAGYGVTFAVDSEEALREAAQPGVELVISAASLDGIGDPLAARARRAGIAAPWVIAAAPRETARAQASVNALRQVAVYDAYGPPENVLFVANELTRRGATDARASARVLYGTAVRFRGAGACLDEVGYSYNVSAGGVYVRTLAPLSRGSDVWLELCPPRADRRVRLEGRVVWTRGFGPNDAATVPPGFGVQITGGSVGDLERYGRGYHTFVAELAAH